MLGGFTEVASSTVTIVTLRTILFWSKDDAASPWARSP